MPSLVPGGPDLPAALLHALEDDRLVLLCGAGVSIDTGLPSFRGLVEEAAAGCNLALDGAPGDAFRANDLDRALGHLEKKEGRRGRLREWIAERLVRDPEGPDAGLRLHRALLDLARRPSGGYRLVTTNFDDRFERAGLKSDAMEDAPRLAPPRFDHLRRVVFLHGRIRKRDPSSHAELVLTSRDFGNAYLRDGWAARFVLELLREFHLLLVGYSLSDPVLRYLVDAIAAESHPGGQFRKVWALAAFDPERNGEKGRVEAEWQAKNVEPILYRAPKHDHAKLRETLVEWARRHKGGLEARARVALETMRTPFDSSRDSEALANVVWALAEESGRTARAVADVVREKDRPDIEKPHPSWLLALLKTEVHDPRSSRDPAARCKLLDLAPVAEALCNWFSELRGDFAFLRLVVELKPSFPAEWMEWAWRANRPYELHPIARNFWWSYATQRAEYPIPLSHLGDDEVVSELSALTRLHLARGLSPIVKRLEDSSAERYRIIRAQYTYGPEPLEPSRLAELAAFELGFSSREAARQLRDAIVEGRLSGGTLAEMLDDLTSVLAEHCRLSEVVNSEPSRGSTNFTLVSLDRDPDPNEQEPWRIFVGFLTQGLRAAIENDRRKAEAIIERWWLIWRTTGFPLFARLWLWGVARCPSALVEPAMDWLRADESRLWADEWERELRLLLLKRGTSLSKKDLSCLLTKVFSGPEAETVANFDEKRRNEVVEHLRNQRLAALARSGVTIPKRYAKRVDKATAKVRAHEDSLRQHPKGWPFDEVGPLHGVIFGGWVPRPELPDLDRLTPEDIAARIRGWEDEWGRDDRAAEALARAVRGSPHAPSAIAKALLDRVEDRAGVWRGFWSGLAHQNPAPAHDLEALVDLVQQRQEVLPDAALVSHAWWLRAVAAQELDERHQSTFLRGWDLAWQRTASDAHLGALEAPNLTTAINSDAGALAEALIARLSASKPTRGVKLPDWFAKRAGRILEGEGRSRQLATICLAAALSFLFAVDSDWTRAHLLPLFDPGRSPDLALQVWEAWLHAPRLDAELIQAIAPALMRTAGRARELEGVWPATFPSLLVDASIGQPESFPQRELLEALRQLGPELLAHALARLAYELESAGEKAAEYWRSYIGPWFETYWPGEQEFRQGTVRVAANRLLLHTGEAFPEALAILQKLRLVGELPGDDHEFHMILHHVAKSIDRNATATSFDLPGYFPEKFVAWLSIIIGRALSRHFYFARIREGLKRLPHDTPGLAELEETLR